MALLGAGQDRCGRVLTPASGGEGAVRGACSSSAPGSTSPTSPTRMRLFAALIRSEPRRAAPACAGSPRDRMRRARVTGSRAPTSPHLHVGVEEGRVLGGRSRDPLSTTKWKPPPTHHAVDGRHHRLPDAVLDRRQVSWSTTGRRGGAHARCGPPARLESPAAMAVTSMPVQKALDPPRPSRSRRVMTSSSALISSQSARGDSIGGGDVEGVVLLHLGTIQRDASPRAPRACRRAKALVAHQPFPRMAMPQAVGMPADVVGEGDLGVLHLALARPDPGAGGCSRRSCARRWRRSGWPKALEPAVGVHGEIAARARSVPLGDVLLRRPLLA